MNLATRIDYARLMEPVALKLLGEPNIRLSKPPHDVRFGTQGSMAVDYDGKWFDHENQIGGGVLDLIKFKTGRDHGEAQAWLRREGICLSSSQSPVLYSASAKILRKEVATYDYTDEHGELLFQVVRYEPKAFRQRRPNGRGGWEWSLGGVRRVLYRLPDLARAIQRGETIYVVEGEKDVHALLKNSLHATCNPGGVGKWRAEYTECLRGGDVVIISDNDEAGRKHAEEVAASLHGIASHIRTLDLGKHWPACPSKGDISDWFAVGFTAGELKTLAAPLPAWKPSAKTSPTLVANVAFDQTQVKWAEPKPLPNGMAPVEAFSSDFLPAALAPWVEDIANRLQCAPDYVAVTAITALGSIIGRRIGIKPQMRTDWVEIPNLWGAFIGRPGMLKSPAMGEALKPIHHLEAEAVKSNEAAQRDYVAALEGFKLRRQVKASLDKEALKQNPKNSPNSEMDLGDEPQMPPNNRYRTNDPSYESLGELLISNPNGILVERDELISLLRHLDRDDQGNARGFYLSGWSGTQPYTFDRIIRGHRPSGLRLRSREHPTCQDC
jgi:hypothetical protein